MTEPQTIAPYNRVMEENKEIFLKKSMDYGTSWRVLRPISITDQIMIKALRIRHIQQTGLQKVADTLEGEYGGIINYGIIALIQEELPQDDHWELSVEEAERRYDRKVDDIRLLMQNKNHDYGEAWRQMSPESFVDLILSKLQRIRQMIKHQGKTLVSEGMTSNFMDIVNYAAFALITQAEKKDKE